jgi:predicted AlkP superfamily phosphohydrolase/phosphomutase
MAGAFAVNEWIIKEGYLKLKEKPRRPGTDLTREMIDWDSTVAWGWGGYYSRIFINLKGREPKGIVGREEFEDVVTQLSNDLRRVRGDNGALWRNIVLRPEEIYPEVRGDPPDLMAYFDDLSWRAAGTVGWDTPFLPENDRGPDDAVHDWHGVFTIYDPEGTVPRGMGGEMPIERIANYLRELMLSKS